MRNVVIYRTMSVLQKGLVNFYFSKLSEDYLKWMLNQIYCCMASDPEKGSQIPQQGKINPNGEMSR